MKEKEMSFFSSSSINTNEKPKKENSIHFVSLLKNKKKQNKKRTEMYDPVPTSQRFSSVPQSNSVVPYSRYDSHVSSQPDSTARKLLNNSNPSVATAS